VTEDETNGSALETGGEEAAQEGTSPVPGVGEVSPAEENRPADETSAVEAGDGESDAVPDAATTGIWPVDRLKPVVEALVFAAGDPLPIKKIVDFVEGSTADEVKATLTELGTDLLTRGIRLVEVAGGWQMRTAPEHQRYVRKLFRERPQKLTRAATETVAIVAYKQPATRQEIEVVRGVDSGGVLESLVEKRLVKVVGRKDVPGRPLVYATTQDFLELFGLKNIRDLPTLPELGNDFERMSDQGGFNESESAAILPLEDEHGTAQDDTGIQGGEAAVADRSGEAADEGAGEGDEGTDEGAGQGDQGAGEGAGEGDQGDDAAGQGDESSAPQGHARRAAEEGDEG